MSRFKISSDFSPKGDQPKAIKKLTEGISKNISDQVLLGVTGSGKTFTMAHVIEKVNKPTLIIAPNKTLAAQFLNYPEPCFVNLGTGVDVTIRELAETIKEVVDFRGQLIFDPTKPAGTMRKLLDVSKAKSLGWKAKVGLREGIEKTYRWFLEHQDSFRK